MRRFIIALLTGLLVTAAPLTLRHEAIGVVDLQEQTALARPGGGSTYRGSSSGSRSGGSTRSSGGSWSGSGSRSSGSGYSSSSGSGRYSGGSDGGAAFSLLVWLFSSSFGIVGFIVAVAAIVLFKVLGDRKAARMEWDAGVAERSQELGHIRSTLERLRRTDPNFSVVLFEDFLYALYGQAQTLRGGGKLSHLTAHLMPPALHALAGLGAVHQVKAIVVGAMRFLSAEGFSQEMAPQVRVEVEFESNYTEVGPNGAEQSFYACEQWVLSRSKSATSRTPDRVRVFTCPNCGAPLEAIDGGKCSYCQAVVNTGQFDWIVEAITISSRETRGPQLTGNTEEQGTGLPTVVDEYVQQRYAELTQRDPQFSWPAFQARVGLIFSNLQISWSNRDERQARPFVSDNLFQMYAYWTEAYRRGGLRNVSEQAKIEGLELVRITSDKFYDAVTIRLSAASLDFTLADADGRVVSGSRKRQRRYTEYWTLIRGSQRRGTARSDAVCPSCGAPLAIEMAGTCTYCHAKITSGDFDWVLSRIEQDESYQG